MRPGSVCPVIVVLARPSRRTGDTGHSRRTTRIALKVIHYLHIQELGEINCRFARIPCLYQDFTLVRRILMWNHDLLAAIP